MTDSSDLLAEDPAKYLRNGNAAPRPNRFRDALAAAMLLLAAVLFLLHYLHLGADFPNGSPWSDWAKYTDEGWYGDAAIRHYLRGTWHLPGDFNPAAALPVWPLLEAIVFRFTGVGIVAARTLSVTVFGGILACGFLLLLQPAGSFGPQLRSSPSETSCIFRPHLLGAAAGVLLLAASPYLYVFSRMAVLEPLLVLLGLLAMLTASRISAGLRPWRRLILEVAVGAYIALMIGTKTTAASLIPAIAFMLASACGWKPREVLRTASVTGATIALFCGVYYLTFIRPQYLEDFRYLFSANQYTGISAENAMQVLGDALRDGMWIGSFLYPLFGAALLFALVRRAIWRDAVFVSLLLWICGYFAFLLYHANLQPRYYFVIAVPITLLVVRAAEHARTPSSNAGLFFLPVLLALVIPEARQTLHYVRRPDYSFQTAAHQIERVVESEPAHSHTVLSISGSDLSLMTGLPSICDDFGTMDLEDRIAAYHPGWFVAWNYVEDDKMEALAKFYRLTRVAAFPAMDDPDRNLMIVYRLDPKEGVKPRRRRGHGRQHGLGFLDRSPSPASQKIKVSPRSETL